MPKTIPHAQREQERNQRQQKELEEQKKVKAQHAEQIKKDLVERKQSEKVPVIDNKERRRLKVEKKRQEKVQEQKKLIASVFNVASIDESKNVANPVSFFANTSNQRTQERNTAEQAENDAAKEEAKKSTNAIVVQNHSTYCEGIQPVICRLQKLLPGCKIIPGKLSTVESKAEEFALRFQSTYESSYKFVARKGTTTQDLVIVVSNTKIYTQKIVQEKVDEALAPKSQAVSDKTDIPILSNYNRIKFQTSRALHKASVEKKQEHSQEKGKKVIEGKKVEDRARTLRTKGLDQDTAPQVAKRDESIVSGNERTRNSMKN